MKKQLLFFALLVALSACQNENDVRPNQAITSAASGLYQTNFFLDPSCVAIPDGKMPYAEIKKETDSTITIAYTRFYPDKEIRQLEHVLLSRQAESIQLKLNKASIGSIQTDRIFTDKGMEKEGQVLRINWQKTPQDFIYFTGYK
ncbi:hypothetical protein [Spirosoma terrae]|uniref:Lipoprotein n=1 Tax=Spirosoma terrae TaxID=1968276 RepID=A0A6L9L1W1_9BACT|nr:hypothetical protein [Spirosoma terrae]NDU93417.1 hypothetical protein [Spirosoma terrae]